MGEWKSKLAGIYMLTFPNGKVYVGKSVHLKKRLIEHKSNEGSNTMLKEARQMFEWDAIKKEYLGTFEVDENTDISALTLILDEKEREYIQKYKSNNKEFGYNQYDGGSHGKGYVCSDEHKKKLSMSHIGKKLPQQARKRKGNYQMRLKEESRPRNAKKHD